MLEENSLLKALLNSTRRYCLSLVKEMKSRWLNPLLNCFKRNWLRLVRGRKYHLSQVLCPAGPGRPDCKKNSKISDLTEKQCRPRLVHSNQGLPLFVCCINLACSRLWNFRQFRILRILMVRAPV